MFQNIPIINVKTQKNVVIQSSHLCEANLLIKPLTNWMVVTEAKNKLKTLFACEGAGMMARLDSPNLITCIINFVGCVPP